MAIRSFRWPLIIIGLLGVSLAGAWAVRSESSASASELIVTVHPADFAVTVTTAGELRAPKFTGVTSPPELEAAQVWQLKIDSLVPEGTIVHKGDFVARLDQTPLTQRISYTSLELQKAQAVYEQAQLDSTLNLSTERDNLQTLQSAVEEKTLAQEQAAFEAPAIKRQAAIAVERARRALEQAKLDYQTKVKKADATMRQVGADLEQARRQFQTAQNVVDQLTILAPADGIVSHWVNPWDGAKRGMGDQITAGQPMVAMLPDLSVMESVTYLNEIDVRKVTAGLPVTLKLDADPSKVLRGRVSSVAGAGEQRPNSDAKVFEVHVAIEGTDTTLRPGMTTSNTIAVQHVANALAVPLEALGNDHGVAFVYKRAGHVVKQEVRPGAINEDAVVITQGLVPGDRILLATPTNADRLPLVRLPSASGSRDTAGK